MITEGWKERNTKRERAKGVRREGQRRRKKEQERASESDKTCISPASIITTMRRYREAKLIAAVTVVTLITVKWSEREVSVSMAWARKRTRRVFSALDSARIARKRASEGRKEGTYGRSPEVLRETKRARERERRGVHGEGEWVGGVGWRGSSGDKGFIRGSLLLPLKSLACCR